MHSCRLSDCSCPRAVRCRDAGQNILKLNFPLYIPSLCCACTHVPLNTCPPCMVLHVLLTTLTILCTIPSVTCSHSTRRASASAARKLLLGGYRSRRHESVKMKQEKAYHLRKKSQTKPRRRCTVDCRRCS